MSVRTEQTEGRAQAAKPAGEEILASPAERKRSVKVLVWDLDDTLWLGTLLEGDDLVVRPGVAEVIQTLDRRGILQSVASKGEAEPALAKLAELGLADCFLAPQIRWSPKSEALRVLSRTFNLDLDSFAFIDDQAYERAEVASALPSVLVLAPDALDDLLERAEFSPRFVTDESAQRRRMYQAEIARAQAEDSFAGPPEAFSASLGMVFSVAPARVEDLKRAEELTIRTNQLNSTGISYSFDELLGFLTRDDHDLVVAELEDRFGCYGKVGLALVEKHSGLWRVRLVLMSCRVLARGAGSLLLSYLLAKARQAGARVQADCRATGRNRLMRVALGFAGFRSIEKRGDLELLEHDGVTESRFPAYVELRDLCAP